MLRRTIIVLLLAVPVASASDDACTREILKPVGAAAVASRIDVAPLFVQQAVQSDGTVVAAPISGMEVLVARIGRDGKPVLACVDSAEAAKRFLEAPIDQVARTRKEQ